MTDADSARILAKLDRLDEKHDKTREDIASLTTSVRGLEGWAESMNGKLVDVTKTANETSALQKSCPARRAFDADATGPRQAMPSETAIRIVEAVPTQPAPEPRPSIRPEHVRGAAVGGGGVAIILALLSLLAWALGAPIP